MKASITFHGTAVAQCVELFKSRPVLQTVSYVTCFLGGKYFKWEIYLKKQCIPDTYLNMRIFFIIHQLKHGVTS